MIAPLLLAGAALVGGVILLSRRVAVGPVGDEAADSSGLVKAEPFRLAEKRGCTLDEYALARMMTSEATSKASRIAVGWAALNHAAARGESISTVLLRGKGSSDGHFGGQNLGKYASTKDVPPPNVVADAKSIIKGTIKDPTNGCRQWDSPAAQDKMLKNKVPGYKKSSAEIAVERSRANDLVMVAGVPDTRFWRPKGVKTA